MQYNNLQDLIRNSRSTRKYFLTLSVPMQMELHNHNEYIHSAQQLHRRVDLIEKQHHYTQNSNYYFNKNSN